MHYYAYNVINLIYKHNNWFYDVLILSGSGGMNIVILDDYQDAIRKLDCVKKVERHFNIKVYTSKAKGISQLADRLKDADILILNYARTQITRQILERSLKLKLIIQIGELSEHLDTKACDKLNIAVLEGKENPIDIAEYTWAMIMTVMRRIPQYANILRHGGWQQSGLKQASMPANFALGSTLQGKTLGVWGLGHIGSLVANYGKNFGMNVLVWGSEISRHKALQLGYAAAPSRDVFFQTSDVVSVHLRPTHHNHRIIGIREFLLMKPTSLFVNTANASLVDTEALVSALGRGTPGLAAIDTYDTEPIMQGHALMRLENCICTPHIANVTKESIEQHYTIAFQYILDYMHGKNIPVTNSATLRYK